MKSTNLNKNILVDISIKIIYASCAFFLIFYSIFSLLKKEMYLPRKTGGYYIFIDETLWLLSVSFLCFALSISITLINYNVKDKKGKFKSIKKLAFSCGSILLIAALLLDLFVFHKSYRL
jgi:hypothetical protein